MNYIIYKATLFSTLLLLVISGCSDNSTGLNPGDLTGESVSYEINSVGDESISGKVTFEERIDGFTRVSLELEGQSEESEYPVIIYTNTALEGGEFLIKLTPVDGSSGKSVTIVHLDEDSNTITYEDLLTINAHINVHPDEDDLESIVAQSDIGENAFTGNSLSFELEETNSSGISGSIDFLERESGQALAIIEVTGTDPDHIHIAHLYNGNDEQNEELLLVFNEIDGETGKSMTNISQLDDESAFGYEDLKELEGWINIYFSEDDMTVISKAEITHETE